VQRIENEPPIANKRAFLFRLASNRATDHVRSESSRASIEAKVQAYSAVKPMLSAPHNMPLEVFDA